MQNKFTAPTPFFKLVYEVFLFRFHTGATRLIQPLNGNLYQHDANCKFIIHTVQAFMDSFMVQFSLQTNVSYSSVQELLLICLCTNIYYLSIFGCLLRYAVVFTVLTFYHLADAFLHFFIVILKCIFRSLNQKSCFLFYNLKIAFKP